MNPLLNPFFLIRLITDYLFDVDRLKNSTTQKLETYRNKVFRRMIKYAYTVPLYHDKYKRARVHPSDIKSIKDILKLPFITKQDLKSCYPDGLLPPRVNKEKFQLVSTSGTTQEPVFIYSGYYEMFKTMIGFLRMFKEYDVSWRKSRITIVADLSRGRAERIYLTQTVIPYLQSFFSLKNIQVLNHWDSPKKIIKQIDAFNPEFLGTSPHMLTELATLKRIGYSGRHLNPVCIASSGGILDQYTKRFIQEIFPSSCIFDSYGATESGTISFQCKKGNHHIFSDFVHIETIDENGNTLPAGKEGDIVVTRLYGRGTPVIRYTGLHDRILLSTKECDCGINSPVIRTIYGRKAPFIRLNNGKMFSRFDLVNLISKIVYQLRNKKMVKVQIVQNTLADVDVLVQFYEDEEKNPSVSKEVLTLINDYFCATFGEDINVEVKEVKEIPHTASLVVSKITENEIHF